MSSQHSVDSDAATSCRSQVCPLRLEGARGPGQAEGLAALGRALPFPAPVRVAVHGDTSPCQR